MARQESEAASDEDSGAQAVARAQLGTAPGGLGHLFRQRQAQSGQLNRLPREIARLALERRAAQLAAGQDSAE